LSRLFHVKSDSLRYDGWCLHRLRLLACLLPSLNTPPPPCLSAQATTGTGSPLDIVPTKPHQRAPIYLGCARDVDLVLRYLREEEAAPEGAAAPAGPTPSA